MCVFRAWLRLRELRFRRPLCIPSQIATLTRPPTSGMQLGSHYLCVMHTHQRNHVAVCQRTSRLDTPSVLAASYPSCDVCCVFRRCCLPQNIGDWMFSMYTSGTECVAHFALTCCEHPSSPRFAVAYAALALPSRVPFDDPRVSVLRESNVRLMPPTQIITAEWDVLRDDGLAYVRKLCAAKVQCEHIHYRRSTHGFFSFPTIGAGTDAAWEVVRFVRSMTECL